MKRKRGRRPGKKAAPPTAAPEAASSESPSSPSTEAAISPAEQAEDDAPVTITAAAVVVPEPPPPPPPEPPQKPSAAAPVNPADIPYAKPKVGAVYGRVKLKFKSSKVVEPQPQLGSSEAQAPAADAGKSGSPAVPEVVKEEVAAENTTVLTDGQQTDGRASELSGSDKEKGARKVGGIKIKSAGLSSVQNNILDRKADSVDETPLSKQETVSENKETEDTLETRSSQGSEEKQSTPERQRDEKEVTAALEAIKKVMKMDTAEPFNTPVDPVALGISDYFDIIDTPMDFGTICQDFERGNKYMNSEDVYKDVQFIWDNCTKYNNKGGNDNTGNEDAKGHSKSKSNNKRRRSGNDRHKNDCLCAVCQVTRRKKERDEILAVVENETAAINSNTSEQNNLEGNYGANNPGSHDTSSSQEQPAQTDMYKETAEANDSDIQMEDFRNFSSDQPSSLPHPDYEDEGSRQYFEEKEQVEYRDMNSQDECTPTQPNDYSELEHHQRKA